MGISRRFRWAIGFGALKILAAAVIFIYGKHKAAGPPAHVMGSIRERVEIQTPGKDIGANPRKPGAFAPNAMEATGRIAKIRVQPMGHPH